MKTFLYDQHQALGARFVNFGGWEMPLNYQSVVKEQQQVRKSVGIFDISHMGRIFVEGLEAADFLDYLSTNRIKEMAIGKAIYTVFCNLKGGAVDDLIIYRHQRNHFSVVVNASNRDKDLKHLQLQAKNFDVQVTPHFESEGILAIQGPLSKELLSSFFSEITDLKFMNSIQAKWSHSSLFISRTGYTGELGYEIYGKKEALASLWTTLLEQDKVDIKPIGLAARDILRLEMGFVLYGHELSETIAPNESLAFWTIKWDKEDFLGKDALEKLNQDSSKRSQHGFVLQESAIARPGMHVKINGKQKGIVTSGGFSPSLQKSIGILMLEGKLEPTDQVSIEIRNREVPAQVVGFPFYKKNKKGS